MSFSPPCFMPGVRYGGMAVFDVQRLDVACGENAWLKKLLAGVILYKGGVAGRSGRKVLTADHNPDLAIGKT